MDPKKKLSTWMRDVGDPERRFARSPGAVRVT